MAKARWHFAWLFRESHGRSKFRQILLTSLPLASRWIIPGSAHCHSVINNFNFRVQYLIYALINFFSSFSSAAMNVSLSYSDWVFFYYTILVTDVKISLKYSSISCFLLFLLFRHVWKAFTFLERLDFLYHSVPMTTQVTSERIPRHNPTAKPKLNGFDVPLSAQKRIKIRPLLYQETGC